MIDETDEFICKKWRRILNVLYNVHGIDEKMNSVWESKQRMANEAHTNHVEWEYES